MADVQAQAAGQDEMEIDLRQYLEVLLRRKWEILSLVVVAMVAATVATRLSPRIYEASSTVLIRTTGSSGLPFATDGGFLAGAKDPLQNYVQILKSRDLVVRTARRLHLPSDPTSPEVAQLAQSVKVQPIQGTDTVRVTVSSRDPAFARDAANALVAAFQELNLEYNRQDVRSAQQFIEEQLPKVESQLNQAEELLLRFQESAQVVSPSDETKALLDKISQLETMRAEAEVGLHEVEQRLQEVEKQLQAQPQTLVTARQIADNPMIQYYRTQLADLQTRLAGAQEKYTDKHPEVVDLKAQIDQVRQQLQNEVAKVVPQETESLNPVYQGLLQELLSLQADQLAQAARSDALRHLIDQNDQVLAGLPQKELQLARLTRDVKVNEDIYMMLRTRYEETRITENMKNSDVQLIDPAVKPTAPVSPRPMLNLAIAVFLGLFGGVGLAFVLEFLDTSFRSQEDVERELGLPVLGLIPAMETLPAASASPLRRFQERWQGHGRRHEPRQP
ncbi:MAG: hypothetical protein IMX01_05380 [Limnochordaceae bacterium]|nr:hypothetical protein [Limnochordaceae bacterium]